MRLRQYSAARDNSVVRPRPLLMVQCAAAIAVVTSAGIAAAARAAPKTYLLPALALVLLGFSIRMRPRQLQAATVAAIGGAVCIGGAVAGWGFALDANATARTVEGKYPKDGRVRCVNAPRYEFGDRLFSRIYLCYWDKFGGARPGQGLGVEVDDTHIVRVYP
jgi:hypothetical protein